MNGPANNVVQLRKFKRQRAATQALCDSGLHKWQSVADAKFVVKQGKLVTPQRCERCGRERVELM